MNRVSDFMNIWLELEPRVSRPVLLELAREWRRTSSSTETNSWPLWAERTEMSYNNSNHKSKNGVKWSDIVTRTSATYYLGHPRILDEAGEHSECVSAGKRPKTKSNTRTNQSTTSRPSRDLQPSAFIQVRDLGTILRSSISCSAACRRWAMAAPSTDDDVQSRALSHSEWPPHSFCERSSFQPVNELFLFPAPFL